MLIMLISEKVTEKEFEGRTTKEAYLNCCKWLSTNIIAVNNSKYLTYNIEKVETDDWNRKVKLTLYVTADEGEIQERNCNICKEATGMFYLKQNKYMCEVCRMPSYRQRLKDKLQLIKEGLKGRVIE